MPPAERDHLRELRRLAEETERQFQSASEEDQMLHLLAQQISFVYGGVHSNREEIAKLLITKSHGPKFAERVLGSPELRAKIGLDQSEPETP